jgi:hypothetical protein
MKLFILIRPFGAAAPAGRRADNHYLMWSVFACIKIMFFRERVKADIRVFDYCGRNQGTSLNRA